MAANSTEATMKRNKSLDVMKPLCMTLMHERNTNNVLAILKALPQIDDYVAQEIKVFILFPIKSAFGEKNL